MSKTYSIGPDLSAMHTHDLLILGECQQCLRPFKRSEERQQVAVCGRIFPVCGHCKPALEEAVSKCGLAEAGMR